jgi:purine-binding chemotaxis protein CheW
MGRGRVSTPMASNETSHTPGSAQDTEYVTVMIDGQLFGLPISRVQDVFMPDRLTRVPLASAEIAGVLNLRGRIVTAIDLRRRLGLPPRSSERPPMAVGIELRGESYGLLIDSVGEVMKLADNTQEANPVNLDAKLAAVSAGVHRLDGQLLVILNVDRVLDMTGDTIAA